VGLTKTKMWTACEGGGTAAAASLGADTNDKDDKNFIREQCSTEINLSVDTIEEKMKNAEV
jgi:hypothetical protein